MSFVFHRRHNLHEALHVVRAHAPADGLFEIEKMPVHAPGDRHALPRRRDHERAPIGRADLTGDEAAGGEPIENARQRRALVREAAVEIGDGGRTGAREQRQNVRLALRQTVLTQSGQVETDPVRRSMNVRNQTQ
jgi:hypothetical protein